jgi:hypothetical protein
MSKKDKCPSAVSGRRWAVEILSGPRDGGEICWQKNDASSRHFEKNYDRVEMEMARLCIHELIHMNPYTFVGKYR